MTHSVMEASAPAPPACPRDAEDLPTEVLFPEAKRRERHRRLRVLAITLLSVAVGLLTYAASGLGNGPPASTGRPASPDEASRTTAGLNSGDLSWSCTYSSPAPRVLLAAPPRSEVEVQQRLCYGPGMPTMFRGGNPAQVRLSIPTRDGRKLIPVVMAFNDLSDVHLFIAYGPGSVWIYSASTTSGPLLLRFSDTSGTLLQRVRVPAITAPYGYANATGVWIANGQVGTSLRTDVFHVATGSGLSTCFGISSCQRCRIAKRHLPASLASDIRSSPNLPQASESPTRDPGDRGRAPAETDRADGGNPTRATSALILIKRQHSFAGDPRRDERRRRALLPDGSEAWPPSVPSFSSSSRSRELRFVRLREL
jgi:hypothetical protein